MDSLIIQAVAKAITKNRKKWVEISQKRWFWLKKNDYFWIKFFSFSPQQFQNFMQTIPFLICKAEFHKFYLVNWMLYLILRAF